MNQRVILPGLLLLSALMGCEAAAEVVRGAPAGATCGSPNLTQQCNCDNGAVGAQLCDGSVWTACSCTATNGAAGVAGAMAGTGGMAGLAGTGGSTGPALGVADLNIPDGIVFDWDPKVPFPDGTCEPGLYVGAFDGFYASPAAFQFPVPVVGDVNMVLGESTDGENFEISDGTVSGFANGVFPFESQIVGTLDCTEGTFTGTLVDGWYEVIGIRYFFSGPLLANYNRRTHSFEGGTWDVEEPPVDPMNPPLTPAGGDGTWNATLQP